VGLTSSSKRLKFKKKNSKARTKSPQTVLSRNGHRATKRRRAQSDGPVLQFNVATISELADHLGALQAASRRSRLAGPRGLDQPDALVPAPLALGEYLHAPVVPVSHVQLVRLAHAHAAGLVEAARLAALSADRVLVDELFVEGQDAVLEPVAEEDVAVGRAGE